MREHEGERGAALLTVLLMVAIISVLAATALEKLRLSTRLTGNAVAMDQARAYAIAAETLAVSRLNAQLAAKPDRISLLGGWSGRPFPLPIEDGTATARVTDGANCFNLNGLVGEAQPGVYVARAAEIAAFARLMAVLGVPNENAGAIAAATADWIDSDTTPLPGGAEDASYSAADAPYRTANTLMGDPSELRAVQGMTPAIYAQLRPWLCALPRAAPSTINLDTIAPEQAPLIAALTPGTVSVGQAQAALLRRPPQGFANVGEFWTGLGDSTGGGDATARTAVKTQWFALDIDVTVGGARLAEHALVDATTLPVRLVARQWGERS